MLNPIVKNIHLSTDDYKIYARHIVMDNIGINGQKRIKAARILCVGAGGLASSALLYLISSGVGHIGILDSDVVSISNLQRQILYDHRDINLKKVLVAGDKLKNINTTCTIDTYTFNLDEYNGMLLLRKYDIILDCSDNFATRYLIDNLCYKLHKIHVYGAIRGFEGQVSVFNYKSGPRYSDIYPQRIIDNINICTNEGVAGVLPGTIGILQATEITKIIIGYGTILSGYILIYNALDMSFKRMKIRPPIRKMKYTFKDIYGKNDNSIAKIIHKDELETALNQKHRDLMLIDVRQPIEFKTYHIDHAINIPIKQLTKRQYATDIKNRAGKNKIIIYCSSNSRSIIASHILTKNQIKHSRLFDGLESWIRRERDSNPR